MSVFESLYANQYDSLYKEKDYSAECDLVEQAFGRFSDTRPKTILDIGCGTGTHLIELAKRGYDCAGVDLAPAMLAHAAKKAASEALAHTPKWIEGDARTFDAAGPYDSAIMMFAVVSYLTGNEDVISGLKNIRRHLKPGALFICDFWYGPAVLSVRPNERVRVLETPNGRTIRAAATTVDSFAQTADVAFRLWTVEGDRFVGETQETHKMRYFFPQEFKILLELSGFKCLHLSAFPHLDGQLSDDSWNALCISVAS
jgi:SAM-dependent methyltransferase